MNNLVSIITPVADRTEHLAEALQSVHNQTHRDWEHIIVVDGPISEPVDKILESYHNHKVHIIYLPENYGFPVKGRNVGIAYAHGDFITLLDSDDVMLPDKLSFLTSNIGEADLVYGDCFINEQYCAQQPPPPTLEQAKVGNWLMSGAILAKAQVFKMNPFREEAQFCEDYELWLRLYKKGYKFKKVGGTPVYRYRLWDDNLTNIFSGGEQAEWIEWAKKV